MCNYANHGSILDVNRIGDAVVTVLGKDDLPVSVVNMVQAQRRAFAQALDCLAARPSSDLASLDEATIDSIITSLYRVVSAEGSLLYVFGAVHSLDDARVINSLRESTPGV